MRKMDSFMTRLVIFILLVNYAVGETKALNPTGKQVRPATTKSKNPFAPNSAIFKIPVTDTVNLDFRKSNDKTIQSELLKTLTGLIKDKAMKQEKIVLNIKPPTSSTNAFVKKFTSLLRSETIHVVPDAVIGAQSTIFKKKNGQISTLRLTLYVIRQQKPIIPRSPPKYETSKSNAENSPKPIVEEAEINTTRTENITATVETVLRQLHENSTENGTNETDIFLHLISSTNFTTSEIKGLKRSIKQIVHQLYPNSSTSIKTGLFYKRKSHVSKLEFEIDVKPVKPLIDHLNMKIITQLYNATKRSIGSVSINGTKSIENTTSVIENLLLTRFKNITQEPMYMSMVYLDFSSKNRFSENQEDSLEKSLQEVIHKVFPDSWTSLRNMVTDYPKLNKSILHFSIMAVPRKNLEAYRRKLNVTVISDKSIQPTMDKLKDDLQNLVPYSQVLVQAQDVIAKDLNLLTHILKSQEENLHKEKIPIDLTKGDSSFTEEFEKVLPHILSTLKESVKPLSLQFKVTLPTNIEGNSVNSDICSIIKTLTSKIPEKTRYGHVDIDVTLLPDTDRQSPMLRGIKPELQAASIPHLSTNQTLKLLNLTEPKINVTNEISAKLAEIARQLPNYQENKTKIFNISMIMPGNPSNLSVEDILDIIRRDVKILFPYSQILIHAQSLIAKELNILKLNIGLRPSTDEKNQEVFPIDLSKLGKNIPQELKEILTPLWSNIKSLKSFDLKLKPVNDVSRGVLGNEICSIVDHLSRSLPEDIGLNEISLRTIVIPDNEPKDVDAPRQDESDEFESSEESKDKNISSTLLDLTNPGINMTNKIHIALKNIVEDFKNDTSLILKLPKNETIFNVEDTLKAIKEDLLKLAPYANIIIRTQKKVEDDLQMLELKIELEHKEPTKKFRIDLQDTGEFVPEEVDEVVFDIRKSKNPFSFVLEMVIPKLADLEAASSEICSVNNIVINNVPKDSILSATILRISVSPKSEDISDGISEHTEPLERRKTPDSEEARTTMGNAEKPSLRRMKKTYRTIGNSQDEQPYHSKEEEPELRRPLPKTLSNAVNNRELKPETAKEDEDEKPLSRENQVKTEPTDRNVVEKKEDLIKSLTPRELEKMGKNPAQKRGTTLRNTLPKDDIENFVKRGVHQLESKPKTQKSQVDEKSPLHFEIPKNSRSDHKEELEDDHEKNEVDNRKLKPEIAEEEEDEKPSSGENQGKTEADRNELEKKEELMKSLTPKGLKGTKSMLQAKKPGNPAQKGRRTLKNTLPKDEMTNFWKRGVPQLESEPKPQSPIQKLTTVNPIEEKTEPIPDDIDETTKSIIENVTDDELSSSDEHQDQTKKDNEYPRGSKNSSQIDEESGDENPKVTLNNKQPSTTEEIPKQVEERNLQKLNNPHEELESNENEDSSSPKYGGIKTETPLKASNNDQNDVLRYKENLNLSNSSSSLDDIIKNVAISVVKIIPREDNETVELFLNIILPRGTTMSSLRNITNSVISSLVSELPDDIINVETKVRKDGEGALVSAEIKITISNNNTLGRQIEEEEKLKSKLKNESELVEKLSKILDTLKEDVQEKSEGLTPTDSFVKKTLHSIVSNILSTIKNKPQSRILNLNYSITPTGGENLNHLRDSLREILVNAMPSEDVTVEVHSVENNSYSLQVCLKPQTTFKTSPIDLDHLNLLDVESVLTKIVSQYISGLDGDNETIIIEFVFTTSRISSLNLENIESVFEDVFQSLNIKGELRSEDIKLGLTKDKDIIIHIPCTISTKNFKDETPNLHVQTVKRVSTTPRPFGQISDLILEI